MDRKVVTELINIVGENNCIQQEERMKDYSHDEFSLKEIAHMPECVVLPQTSEEISKILDLANRENIPVTPRGGATGLCGGCVPIFGGIVLSLEKMNRIIEIDKDNQMAVVEAGVRLMDFYHAVEEEGLFFPSHPGEESAMIGGVLANNAGGARAVKHGVFRNYVRGLDVILPTGKNIKIGGKIMKNSTGYPSREVSRAEVAYSSWVAERAASVSRLPRRAGRSTGSTSRRRWSSSREPRPKSTSSGAPKRRDFRSSS